MISGLIYSAWLSEVQTEDAPGINLRLLVETRLGVLYKM